MIRMFGPAAAVVMSVAGFGCGHRVMVPPRIDLRQQEIIGVIEFNCAAEGGLGGLATSKFIDAARQDQGMVRVVRLGSEAEVLQAVGHARLDAAAFQALGEKHGVKTIVTGDLVISEVHPGVAILHSLTQVGVSADVEATLAVQMVETASGASIWSRSASASQQVAGVRFSSNRRVVFNADDPEKAYGKLVHSLVYAVTPDFRATWERR